MGYCVARSKFWNCLPEGKTSYTQVPDTVQVERVEFAATRSPVFAKHRRQPLDRLLFGPYTRNGLMDAIRGSEKKWSKEDYAENSTYLIPISLIQLYLHKDEF